MRFPTFLILRGLASAAGAQASYLIEDDYTPSSFFGMFDFFTSADPTAGYVQYIDQWTAQNDDLINAKNDAVYMGVDSTNVVTGSGRNSIRITSKKFYNHGLVILDLAHMPGGVCGTWPAFWLVGPNWPNHGEIDVIEGVNSQNSNSMTLHTDAGCSITNNGKYTGTMTTSNCDVAAAGQSTNAGCQINNPSSTSYGTGFNSNGGGVYATEWTSDEISIWFFPRSAIPSDITSGSPDPTGWGKATASFSGGCDIDSHFQNLQIVFDTTFCGDWAGTVWSTDSTCSPKASTCQAFVQNNPSAFTNAYWSVNSLRVYQSNGVSSSAAATEAKVVVNTTTPSAAVSGGVLAQVSSQATPLPLLSLALTSTSTNTSTSTSTTTPATTSTISVNSNISAVTLTPALSPALAQPAVTSTMSSAGSYATVTARNTFDFPSFNMAQTAGVSVPARKRHLHRHLARHQKGRHGGV